MVGRVKELPAASAPAEWIVVFCDTGRRRWWDVFTRPGFRHVLVMGFDPTRELWLVYEVSARGSLLTLVEGWALDRLVAGLREQAGARFLRYRPAAAPSLPFAGRPGAPTTASASVFRLGFYCVPAVAHLLGLRCRALRPWGLYRSLLAAGAEPVFEN